MALILLQLQF